MLDLAAVRAEPARLRAALARRGVPAGAVDAVVSADAHHAASLEVAEALRLRSHEPAAERRVIPPPAPTSLQAGDLPPLPRRAESPLPRTASGSNDETAPALDTRPRPL